MVHWQADYAVGHLVRVGQVFGACAFESAVGGELADERVEVAAAEHALVFHLEVEFVARHAVFLCVDEDWEV